MASQALYRKWRSQTFDEMVGQEALKQTLKNALSSGKLAHAYLFTGPRGTGKTTTARLLAKTINCSNPQDGEPCNECQQCQEITVGNSFNVIEIDAASNRGIDSIRELREKVKMPPSAGKYKVYILDEAHMLTTEAFNALLKTLEEPPAHAIFVMATTDVHKMLPTVLSRCQRFDFKRFTTRQIVGHLKHIAELEQIQLEPGASELIARAAAGGMRDALSLLDQAIAYSGQVISLDRVQAMLGVADPRMIYQLIRAVAEQDSANALHRVNELSNAGADLRQVNSQLAEYWRAMMLSRAGANVGEILDSTEDEVREIEQTARMFTLTELTECARIFAQNDLVQRSLGTPQLGLELALLNCIEVHSRGGSSGRAAEPARSVSEGTAPAMPSRNSAAPAPRQSAPPPRPAPPTPTTVEATAPIEREEPEALPDWDNLSSYDDEPPTGPAQDQAEPPTASEPSPMVDVPDEDSGGGLTIHDVKESWEQVKRRIKTKKDGAKIAAILNGYTVVGVENGAQPVVTIQAQGDFHYKMFYQKNEYIAIIEWGLKIALELAQGCRVKLLPPGSSPPGIAVVPPPPPVAPDTTRRDEQQRPASREQPPRRPVRPPRDEPDAPVSASAAGRDGIDPPLARISEVRENTTVLSPAVLEPLEKRLEKTRKVAEADPVVQRVMDMFKAQIKEVKLK